MSDHERSGDVATPVSRREALLRVGAMLGGMAFVGGPRVLEAFDGGSDLHARAARLAASGAGIGAFSAADVALLDEIAETILPATSTPGAKAAKCGPFMALMVTDTYDTGDQDTFRAGLKSLDSASRSAAGSGFMQADARQRLALLRRLDREQKDYMDARDLAEKRAKGLLPGEVVTAGEPRKEAAVRAGARAHYFRMMKELALLGYFTSEIGCTQAQRYAETPARFDPCVPYHKGEKSWAAHA